MDDILSIRVSVTLSIRVSVTLDWMLRTASRNVSDVAVISNV